MTRRGLTSIVLLLSLAACGLGDNQERAEAIIDGVDKVFATGTANGTLTVSMEMVEVPDVGRAAELRSNAPQAAAAAPPQLPPIVFDTALDFRNRRALLTRGGKPAEIFDNLDYYGRRVSATERDARPWLRLRLHDLEENSGDLKVPEDAPVAVSNAVSPIMLVDLAAGALAGSVKRRGLETVNGVAVTRFDANFDVDKTLDTTRDKEYPEDDREALGIAFDRLTVKGTVNKGTAWLDENGRLRGYEVLLRLSRQRDLVFGVRMNLWLHEFGVPVEVAVPSDREILEADSIVAFLRSVVPEMGSRG